MTLQHFMLERGTICSSRAMVVSKYDNGALSQEDPSAR